jgi:homoserine kinase type II
MSGSLDSEAVQVLARYELGGPRSVVRMEAGYRNDNYLVEDAAGRRYVLRRYRRNPHRARMLFQLDFQRALRRLGYPTSDIVALSSGDAIVRSASGPWVLFSHVEGSEYDFSRMGQGAEAGRRLAEFQTVTAQIDLDEPRLDINPDFRRWWTNPDDELAALERTFSGDDVAGEFAYLRSWHTDLLRTWPLARLDALPQGWVHSDFHGRNMVFAGDELRGLFDFDPLHRGYLVEDVAHALVFFARERRGSTQVRLRPEAARIFLDAYCGVRPLSAEERAAVPMMAALVWVPLAPYHELLRRDGEDTLGLFRHYVALMRMLKNELEALVAGGLLA